MLSLTIEHTWDGIPIDADEAVSVVVSSTPSALLLEVEAPFHGDPAPEQPPGPVWKLWEHEVVEVFLLGADDEYLEIELGPRGHYLVLRLRGARNIIERNISLVSHTEIEGGRWRCRALLDPRHLPPDIDRVNCYAIHGRADDRRYLAWAPVPGDEPDFHRLDCFRRVHL